MNFQQLKKNIKKDFSSFPKLKAAVLADSAVQLFCMALRAQGFEAGLDIDIAEGDYDRIYESIIDSGNKIYTEDCGYILILQSTEKIQQQFYLLPYEQRSGFAAAKIKYFESLAATIGKHTKAKVIFFNFTEINDAVFGNFSSKTSYSFLNALRKINSGLQDIAAENKNMFIADVLSAAKRCRCSSSALIQMVYHHTKYFSA